MDFIPNLPEEETETLYTVDGDSVIAPKGGRIHFTADGDFMGIPEDSEISFAPDGDLSATTSDGKRINYFLKK